MLKKSHTVREVRGLGKKILTQSKLPIPRFKSQCQPLKRIAQHWIFH